MHPLAYLITWRCYGTWLPGEPASIDRHHNGFGEATKPQSQLLADYARLEMRDPPMLLTQSQRVTVANALRARSELEGWTLVAENVRTNHVHLVIGASAEPGTVLRVLKASATRALRALDHGLADRRIWARNGSTRYLRTERDVENASHYVVEMQGEARD